MSASILMATQVMADFSFRVPISQTDIDRNYNNTGGSGGSGGGDTETGGGDNPAGGNQEGEGYDEDEGLSAWEQFAEDNNLSYSDWNTISWSNRGLGNIPTEPYPVSNPYNLRFDDNNLTNIDGLSSIITVNSLNLGSNHLTDISGLRNLTSAYRLNLSNNNNLNNLNGLEHLISVNYLDLDRSENLSDISAIANTEIGELIISRDNINRGFTYSGKKLPHDSLLCKRLRSRDTVLVPSDTYGVYISALCESS